MLLQETTRAAAEGAIRRLFDTPLFDIAGTPITLMTLVLFAGIVLLTLWMSHLAQRGTTRALRLRGVTDVGTTGVAARLASYAVLLLGFGVALQTVGVNLGALFAAGAFFAVALGFAMQNVAQNFVSGIILLTERTIKPGDILEVEGRVVRVTHMGLRATVARSRDEEDLIIPNGTLVQNTVTNYTLRDSTYRMTTSVGVSYGSDVDAVVAALTRAAESLPSRLSSHDPRVLFTDFGDSALLFDVQVWVEDPWRARVLRSELNTAIWWTLKEAGIAIPFPQRDVHIIPPREQGGAATA